MRRTSLPPWRICLWNSTWVLLALAFSAHAQTPAEETAPDKQRVETAEERAEAPYEREWFWFICTTNYHLDLKESESQIERQINRGLGLLFPRWDNPTTFKDWGDDFYLWDLSGGFGRDISPKFSWAVYAGGGMGTVPNEKEYMPLGLPLKLNVDFTRRSVFTGAGFTWYPIGKPEKTGRGFWRSLRDTKPQFEMNLGYNYQVSIADVRVRLPFIGRVARIKQDMRYHLYWASPRVGVEIPITKRDTLNILYGELFFLDHGDEFDGYILEFFVRHRF